MPDYDIIVAGAGISGSFAAASAAKAGAKVLILDRNKETEPGKKTNWGWVCGDAVAKTHIEFAERHLNEKFSEPELNLKVDGVYVLSPDMNTKVKFEGEGYSLDRPKFARKILSIAIKNGAEYRPEYEIEGPIMEGEKVVGVFGKNANKSDYKLTAKLVIDALGISSTLRRRLPQNNYIENNVDISDIESTGRYIIEFEKNGDDDRYYDPRNALIHLNQAMAPGGYGWVFPKKSKRAAINVGVGVEKHSLDIRNQKLGKKDTLHSLIDEYIKWNPLIGSYEFSGDDNNGKGYWSVTVRRQFDSLVYNGYMGAGDSMAMPNPISAGGIGPAITAGILAGEVAAEASAENKTDIDYLWKYNVLYNKEYGSKTAGLEVFRVYLQSLNDDLINYGFNHFLTKEEAVQISYGLVPEISIASTFKKVLSGISNINAFQNLLFAVKKMKTLTGLYAQYPKDSSEFMRWKERVNGEIREVKERFKPNPV